MLKNLKKLFISFILMSISLFAVFVAYFSVEIKKEGPLKINKTILIKAGMSGSKIANMLKNEDVIDNKLFFLIYSKYLTKSKLIKAGEYKFIPSMSLIQVSKLLESGETITRRITIPEGLTSYEIVEMLKKEQRLVGEIAEIPNEGSLFPSTYYFKYGDLRSKIISNMQIKMKEHTEKVFSTMGKNQYITNINQLVTLASIIEKEAGNNQEKPLISSVFHNRMKKNMRLQADPTVIYGVTKGKKPLARPISKNDLSDVNEYNTYVIPGLPSKPIANPGLKSLIAAANPVSTEYLYFVVDGKGGHNFTTNFQSHLDNVRKYREKLSN